MALVVADRAFKHGDGEPHQGVNALFGNQLAQSRRRDDIGGNDEEISQPRRVLSQGGPRYSNSVSAIPTWAFIVACFALSPIPEPGA